MAIILLFNDPDRFLGDEWLASAVSIAITYIVFIMGVPALIFQTFIPDALRNIYNEKLGVRGSRFLLLQIILILFLFLQSNHLIYDLEHQYDMPEWFVTLFVIGIIAAILYLGYRYLLHNFYSTRNIEQQLSEKIADDAIHYFAEHKKLGKKDLEDLGLLARELPAGRVKNIFLEQCERLVEYLLNVPNKDRDTKLIGEILENAVCLSATYDGAQVNNENMRKVLDILILTYSHTHRNGMREASTSYLNTTIGNCMKEIGIKAMLKNDLPSVMDAVEKLSAIESTSREMFVLGNEALQHGHVQTTVAVVRKLGGKVRHNTAPGDTLSYDDKRTYYFWLGLVAKIYQLRGSAQNFAERQLQNVVLRFGDHRDEVHALFEETRRHFYHLADFATIDAVRELEEVLFPE
ncbi:MAG: hypothetical protein IPK76_20015 [Lewinellaceae bacterium]|nr:hypothetical protein [Lewinellaceae bacterium]